MIIETQETNMITKKQAITRDLQGKVLTDDGAVLLGYFIAMSVENFDVGDSELHNLTYQSLAGLRPVMSCRMSQHDLSKEAARGFLNWRINVANGMIRHDTSIEINGTKMGLGSYVDSGIVVLFEEGCLSNPLRSTLEEYISDFVSAYNMERNRLESTPVSEDERTGLVFVEEDGSLEGGSDE